MKLSIGLVEGGVFSRYVERYSHVVKKCLKFKNLGFSEKWWD
jgi:hypothetical protein